MKTTTSNTKKRPCFICDGTGMMCDVCGESEAACGCDDETMSSECEDCEGTGIAWMDLDAPEEDKP